jgi:hypothetical protein
MSDSNGEVSVPEVFTKPQPKDIKRIINKLEPDNVLTIDGEDHNVRQIPGTPAYIKANREASLNTSLAVNPIEVVGTPEYLAARTTENPMPTPTNPDTTADTPAASNHPTPGTNNS